MKQRLLESLGIAAVMMALAIIFLLQLSPVSVAGQAPATKATAGTAAASGPGLKTAWGHPDLQGIWLDEFTTPLERPAQYANKEFFTEQERAALNAQLGYDRRLIRAEIGSRQDVADAYNSVFTSAKPAGRRTSMVVEPANGQIPALTPQAKERNRIEQEFRLALLRNTDTCKDQNPNSTSATSRAYMTACKGGQYGPPSPRFAEVFPFYNIERMNRHNGPEDQSLGDRCMSGAEPDFAGFRRIVQGTDSVAISVDTGQGQGFQRVVYLSGSHPPSNIRLRHGDSRGHFEGNVLVVETTNFSPKFPVHGLAENPTLVERFTRLDADTLAYAVTVTDPTVWTAPWTAKQELKMQSDEQNRIYYEPRCYEGNYGLPTMLIGTRLDEKAFAEGTGPDPRSLDTATGGQ